MGGWTKGTIWALGLALLAFGLLVASGWSVPISLGAMLAVVGIPFGLGGLAQMVLGRRELPAYVAYVGGLVVTVAWLSAARRLPMPGQSDVFGFLLWAFIIGSAMESGAATLRSSRTRSQTSATEGSDEA